MDAKNADRTPTLGRTLKVIYTLMLDAGLTLPQVAQFLDFKSAKLIKEELAAKIQNDLVRCEWLELASLAKLAVFRLFQNVDNLMLAEFTFRHCFRFSLAFYFDRKL